jgi:hypothetical protein
MYVYLHVKYPLFLSDFNETWIFPTDFIKIPHILNFMKIRPLGADLFHADITKPIVAFHSFVNALKTEVRVT